MPKYMIEKVAAASLPDAVFWDNTDWPSDLISVSDFERGDDDDDDDDKVLDFLPLENPHLILKKSALKKIGGKIYDSQKVQVLTDIFTEVSNGEVEVKTQDTSWIKHVYLPAASDVPNLSEFQLTCNSEKEVSVHTKKPNGEYALKGMVSNGNVLILAVFDGAWIAEDEYEEPTPNPTPAPTTAAENKNPPVLEGTVLFAQSQIIPSKHGIDGDHQPHLVALRKTLVVLACSEHTKRKICKKDTDNRCTWKKTRVPKCEAKNCSDLGRKKGCQKWGCKWKPSYVKCVNP